MKQTLDQLITKARSDIIIDLVFFGTLMVGLRMIPNKFIPTFRMDGDKIEYNPTYAETLSVKELRTVICEAIMHGALGHQFRLEGRDPAKWNMACDFAVAQVFRDANNHAAKPVAQGGCAQLRDYFSLDGELGKFCPHVPDFDNKSVEEIYNLLPSMPKPPPSPGGGKGGKGDPNAPKQQQPGKSDDQDGNVDPGQEDHSQDAPLSSCEIAQTPGDSAERDEKEGQWEVKVIQAANAQKQMGTLPALLQRLVDSITKPRVPWREQLRQFFSVRQRDDFSWKRPKGAFAHLGIYLPSLDSVRMGPIVVAVDTSGSVTDQILQAFQTEVQAVVDECMPSRLVVIYCDAEVNKVKEYEAGDIIELKAIGGGGTDFRPVFNYVETSDIDPCCVVYLTDLMGSFPETPPAYPVLWGSVEKESKAPFGETIYVDVNS